jgi:hypothetical protein
MYNDSISKRKGQNMKNAQIEFHLVRKYDGKTVVHVAETLGEFLAFRENAEKSLATPVIGWESYTIVYPTASSVYRHPERLVSKIVNRTLERIRNGGKENIA